MDAIARCGGGPARIHATMVILRCKFSVRMSASTGWRASPPSHRQSVTPATPKSRPASACALVTPAGRPGLRELAAAAAADCRCDRSEDQATLGQLEFPVSWPVIALAATARVLLVLGIPRWRVQHHDVCPSPPQASGVHRLVLQTCGLAFDAQLDRHAGKPSTHFMSGRQNCLCMISGFSRTQGVHCVRRGNDAARA